MTDDTDHPLDSQLGGDNLVHLPVIKVERSGKSRERKPRGRVGAPKGNKYAVGNRGGHGGPAKYRPEFVDLARKAAEAGLTDRELIESFGIVGKTFNEWKIRHPEFAAAISVGRTIADDRVEGSLYTRAVGYEYEAEKVFANGYRATIREHVPPDVGAAQFWLKNRRPAQWRDVQKVDHTHQVKSSAELLEELKQDILELGLLPDGSFGPKEAE